MSKSKRWNGEKLGCFDHVSPITESDARLREYVSDAELPALLAALYMLFGDVDLLADEIRPITTRMGASIKPQGGMSSDAQALARSTAVRFLARYRDSGSPAPDVEQCEGRLERIVDFLTLGAGGDHLHLLRNELALPRDRGAPDWRKEQIAPNRDFHVAVIGAGISGIAAAYRLSQAGIQFTVFERNSEVGGVWWANKYPGCRLDTPNFAYSFSFAQKQDWPQQFSRQAEIEMYLRQVADATAMKERIKFNTEVVELQFNEPTASWKLVARNAEGRRSEHEFQAVVTAVGQLSNPSFPDIPGRDEFGGLSVHSAQWPEKIDLAGKRVAVIGSGASAFQIVPAIADHAAELKIFQRNAPWMLPTPSYYDDIKPGMTWLLKHVPYYGRWFRFWQFWVGAEGRLPLVEVEPDWIHPISVGRANESLRQECLEHLRIQFRDRPDLLEKMTPNYPPGAKRMLRDNGAWGGALRKDHVHLITEKIARIDHDGIIEADGKKHHADVMIYATGFLSSDYLHPIKVKGVAKKDLHAWWAGDCRAYLGITIPDFPNLFMIQGPNTGVVVNGSTIFMAECAVEYTLSAIKEILSSRLFALSCKVEPFEQFNKYVDAGNLKKAWGTDKTTSWYKNSYGRASQTWPFPLLEYWELTRSVRAEDYLAIP